MKKLQNMAQIEENLIRIQNAKSDIKLAIESKGIEVGDAKIGSYANLINDIKTGEDFYETIQENYYSKEDIDSFNYVNTTTLLNNYYLKNDVDNNFLKISEGSILGNLNIGNSSSEDVYSIQQYRNIPARNHSYKVQQLIDAYGNITLQRLVDNKVDSKISFRHDGLKIAYSGSEGNSSTTTYNVATEDFVNSKVDKIVWTGTQSEYDALIDKTGYNLYLIKE